jgi:hypothetical protein
MLSSPTVLGFSIYLSINFSTCQFGSITPNVSDGVCCLSFKNCVLGESKASPNIDANVLFKTLTLKIKHLFFDFFSKTYNIFYIRNKKVSRFQQGLTNMNLFINTYYPL